ncbi:MAG: serine--tRNA ligase [Holophagaceae bacterium]|nr:serine--tRNA ligase [Holophagaceae bacterium]
MLDATLLRHGLDTVAEKLTTKNFTLDCEGFSRLDLERRRIISEAESLKAERNKVSEEVAKLKRLTEPVDHLIAQQHEMGGRLKALESAEREAENAFRDFMSRIPNIPHESVPIGKDESGNVEIKRWGNPQEINNPLDHVEIATKLGIMDFERASKISGARFTVLRGMGAKLERALIQFFLDQNIQAGWEELLVPYMVLPHTVFGTGQLPKFEHDLFKTFKGEETLYLIPTAEVPVTNIYRDEIIGAESLPIRHCAFTPCFRSEAGSYGKDTKGYIRQHQFHKVELVAFTSPENGATELEHLTRQAESLLEALELPYRRVELCSGDLGFGSQKTFDLEVWLPSQKCYREISSCSWYGDFQARRANLKYKAKEAKKPDFLHTLNGSGLAVGRTLVAILENFQQKDNSVLVPKILRNLMGTDILK